MAQRIQKSTVDLVSQLLAINESQNACPVHELCDGTCFIQPPVKFQPYILGHCELSVTTAAAPFRATKDGLVPKVFDRALESFAYTPISDPAERIIRLIKIHKAAFRSDPIECDMIETPIAKPLKYSAISYFTDPDDLTATVICNSRALRVSSSLNQILHRYRRCRHHGSGGTHEWPDYVWIDGVCINQESPQERDEFTHLRDDIYRLAKRVIVDLGNAGVAVYPGLDVMHRAAFMSEFLAGDTREADPMSLYSQLGFPLPQDSVWGQFRTIFSAPYFTRVEVIPEITLSRETEVLFGRFNFRWQTLIDATLFLRRHGFFSLGVLRFSTSAGGSAGRGLANFFRLLEIRRGFDSIKTSLQLLDMARTFRATDPRDKLFRIRSLMPPHGRGFLVDYSLPPEVVYTQFAAQQISLGNTPALLDFAGLQWRDLDSTRSTLPSWVPDWSAHIHAENGPKRPMVVSTLRPTAYSASGTLEAQFLLVPNEKDDVVSDASRDRLITSCYKIGELRRVAHIFCFEANKITQDFTSQVEGALDLVRLASTARARYEDCFSALARLLLMDDDYTGGNAIQSVTSISDPHSTLRQIMDMGRATSGADMLGYQVASDGATQTFIMQMMTACSQRRFAITDSGYMCLVPSVVREGDRVVVFPGCTVPHVVRWTGNGDQYKLIGDVYVEGIMYGEVLTGSESQLEDLLLV